MSGTRRPQRSSALDPRAAEAAARFVRVLARAGCAPEEIGRAVLRACRTIPASWRRHARAEIPTVDAAAHVLTLWHSDPAYLDARGRPRALPLGEKGPSMETLLRRADPELHLSEVLPHLLHTRAVRRLGNGRFLPNDRALSFQGFGEPYHSRGVRGLLAMLRTLDHNSSPARQVPKWFEMFALNAHFPVSARPAFDDRIRSRGRKFLFQTDTDMHRRERARRKGEPTVPLGVGIYVFEELPFRGRKLRRKRTRRRTRK